MNPNLDQRLVQQAAAEAIASLPAPEFGRVAVENRDLQLVFRHDCLWVTGHAESQNHLLLTHISLHLAKRHHPALAVMLAPDHMPSWVALVAGH